MGRSTGSPPTHPRRTCDHGNLTHLFGERPSPPCLEKTPKATEVPRNVGLKTSGKRYLNTVSIPSTALTA